VAGARHGADLQKLGQRELSGALIRDGLRERNRALEGQQGEGEESDGRASHGAPLPHC
jgi:hypothetical protein